MKWKYTCLYKFMIAVIIHCLNGSELIWKYSSKTSNALDKAFNKTESDLFVFLYDVVIHKRTKYQKLKATQKAYMSRLMTKPTNDCAPNEASDQSWHPPNLISLRCPLEEG